MTIFEYLGVLISVIMGLGITHILMGISKMINDRGTLQLYLAHVVWSLNILLYILAIWWGMFWWSTLEHWSFFQFIYIALYAIALFLLAAVLYPRDIPKNFDFKTHFIENRRWFFGIQFLAWVIDIPETTMKAGADLRGLPPMYYVFVTCMLSISAVGMITKNARLHVGLAVIWLIVVASYLGLTTLSEITA